MCDLSPGTEIRLFEASVTDLCHGLLVDIDEEGAVLGRTSERPDAPVRLEIDSIEEVDVHETKTP
jgi:hypothetical protein